MPRVSIRTLAKETGLSVATISLALRDSPRVLPETKNCVRQAAARAGYRANPLVCSVMSSLRRAADASYHGALLALEYSAREKPVLNPYHREVYQGARHRAVELGYSLDLCWIGPRILSLQRFASIVRARRIRGVVVMPFAETVDFSALDWEPLASAVIDYCVSAPILYTVIPDHHTALFNALEQLATRGYRRPGLVPERWRDARIKHRWSAGYASYCHKQEIRGLPVLLAEPLDREAFLRWFDRHRPDVVIGHPQEHITGWLHEIGVRIPRDVGFFQLNWNERSAPCAGFDMQPAMLGAAAVESAVAQIQRNESGIPKNPKTIMLPVRWVDGPTLQSGK